MPPGLAYLLVFVLFSVGGGPLSAQAATGSGKLSIDSFSGLFVVAAASSASAVTIASTSSATTVASTVAVASFYCPAVAVAVAPAVTSARAFAFCLLARR